MNLRLIEHRLKAKSNIISLQDQLINIKKQKCRAYILIESEDMYNKSIQLIKEIYSDITFNIHYDNNIKRLNLEPENNWRLTWCGLSCNTPVTCLSKSKCSIATKLNYK